MTRSQPGRRMDEGAAVADVVTSLSLPFEPGCLEIIPTGDLYGSPFDVTRMATASVAAALWAVAVFDARRRGVPVERVYLDGRHAAASFVSERVLAVPSLPGERLWDDLSGDYRTTDGWIRIHTNLPAHRRRALGFLGVPADREAVARVVSGWRSVELEDALAAAGAVAGAMRSREQWRRHPQRVALGAEPLVDVTVGAIAGTPSDREPRPLLEGLRVLDLSRVIAGPVAGRFLASFGADVLRIDAPHLDDGLLVQIDTSVGKGRTTLDLTNRTDRRSFEELVSQVDVLIEAFRPGVLEDLGFDDGRLRELGPSLTVGHLSAYGRGGPWASRRGFDSVLQAVSGIAHACGIDTGTGPASMPASALDHGSGYLLAAGLLAARSASDGDGRPRAVAVSLARTAEWLWDHALATPLPPTPVPRRDVADLMDVSWTEWGPLEHVRPPGRVGLRPARWLRPPLPRDPGERPAPQNPALEERA